MSLHFCTKHLTDLIGGLRHRGMGKLLHCMEQPKEYSERFAKRWVEGTAAREEFDPLIVATLELNKKYVETWGPPMNGGDRCSLCWAGANAMSTKVPERWLEACCDQLAEIAKRNELL